MMKPAKFVDGIIAQTVEPGEMVDEDDGGIMLAMLKMFKDGPVGLMWSPLFFTNPAMPMPDELREALVKTLRFHADRLEDRSLDERMKQVAGKMGGEA